MRKRKQITARRKTGILSELLKVGSSVSEISRTYNVSKQSLHRWRKEHKFGSSGTSQPSQRELSDIRDKFVEVSVHEADSVLKKASLIFDNFSISIDGKISSSKLLEIIKLLEGTTC